MLIFKQKQVLYISTILLQCHVLIPHDFFFISSIIMFYLYRYRQVLRLGIHYRLILLIRLRQKLNMEIQKNQNLFSNLTDIVMKNR